MLRLKKNISAAFAISIFAFVIPARSHAKMGTNTVTVYAGPQSVAPEETISVTVEATASSGESLSDTAIELSFIADGRLQTLTAETKQGLVSFEVPAQKTAGVMSFSAKALGETSNPAQVLITSAAPKEFSIRPKTGKPLGHVQIQTSVITDKYGNLISDMTPVTFDWIDSAGLKAKQMSKLQNGKIAVTLACPKTYTGTLKLRASLHTLQITSANIASLCLGKDG